MDFTQAARAAGQPRGHMQRHPLLPYTLVGTTRGQGANAEGHNTAFKLEKRAVLSIKNAEMEYTLFQGGYYRAMDILILTYL